MRRFFVLVRTAALEALSEPLSSVLFLSALLAVPLLPVFHCHQFGDPARLPRECGLSLLLVFGLVFATSSAVRVIGGELNKGTASAVLARAVPRSLFFCAKATGVLVAFALFAAAVTLATLVSAATAETGSRLMSHHGGSSVWGFGVAMSTGLTLRVYAAAACAKCRVGDAVLFDIVLRAFRDARDRRGNRAAVRRRTPCVSSCGSVCRFDGRVLRADRVRGRVGRPA